MASPLSESSRSLDHDRWQELLYNRLRGEAHPAIVFDDTTIPGASLWSGARSWVRTFRESGLNSGDRVILALPAGAPFVQVLLAGIWEKLTVVVKPPGTVTQGEVREMDASLVVNNTQSDHYYARPDGVSGPEDETIEPREPGWSATPECRLLMKTSGTTGQPTWYGLSDRNILSVLESHRPELTSVDSALSYLPWHHCFGLILDLLYNLLTGKIIIRDPSGGRDLDRLTDLIERYEPEQCHFVPKTIQQLYERRDGDYIDGFEEGIVGGAPITASMADHLNGSNLRVGYGLTEASPGVSLGDRGQFEPGFLGRPVGCSVRVNGDDTLEFYGPNACMGEWDTSTGEMIGKDVPRWVKTGDEVIQKEGGLYFQGRDDFRIPLPNGRLLQPKKIEQKLCSSFTAVRRAAVLSPDSVEGLIVCLRVESTDSCPSRPRILSMLQGLADYVQSIHFLTDRSMPTGKKGQIDRTSLRDHLFNKPPT